MRYTGIFFCILFICCQSPADKKILDEFKKVDAEIDKKNQALEEGTSDLNRKTRRKNLNLHPYLNDIVHAAKVVMKDLARRAKE